jgi:Cof subfamily protein (haloacid dehalogenase superfamily)
MAYRYRLIAMDLDGTLNNDQKVITPKTREALMTAQKQGVRLALASARPSPGLYKERDILRMQVYGGILMSYNGGRIVDAATGKVLFETAMDLAQTQAVLRFLETLPVTPILDDGRQFYVTDKAAFKVDYECRNNNMIATEVGNLADFLNFSPIKILMSVQPEQLKDVQRQIADFLPEDLTVVQTAPFYLEVIPKRINKGQGIRDICRTLGLKAEDVIAFGDAENDIPMLQAAGMGVAMGNATQAVKANADYVTLTNNEDGIAAALEALLRGE